MNPAEDQINKIEKSSKNEGTYHHHCCHHHGPGQHCLPDTQLSASNGVQFRTDTGSGWWLPALLPLSCAVAVFTESAFPRDSGVALSCLAFQSVVNCFYVFNWFERTKKTFPICQHKTKSEERDSLQKDDLHVEYHQLRKKKKSVKYRSGQSLLSSDAAKLSYFVHIFVFLYMYSTVDVGFLMLLALLMMNFVVQLVCSQWLLHHHSSSFTLGEWLTTGQCLSVSLTYCLMSLVTNCSPQLTYESCQLGSFLQLAVVVCSLLVLLLLLLPSSYRSRFLIVLLLITTLAVAGLVWASIIVGEFIPTWLLKEFFTDDDIESRTMAINCLRQQYQKTCGGLTSTRRFSSQTFPSWSFGQTASYASGTKFASLVGFKHWFGGNRNSWFSVLFGSSDSESWFFVRWFRYLFVGAISGIASYISAVLYDSSSNSYSEGQQAGNFAWTRLLLFVFWSACTVVAWMATDWVQRYRGISVSVLRKFYHLVASAVFVAGVLVDPVFLKVATVAATLALLILEVVRLNGVYWLSETVTAAFSSFLDEKDSKGGKSLILSHFYLLIGLSLPLWLTSVPSPYVARYCNAVETPFHNNNDVTHIHKHFIPVEKLSTIEDSDVIKANYDNILRSCKQTEEFMARDSKIPDESERSEACERKSSGTRQDLASTCRCLPATTTLVLLAGVLSVGIGDTFASVVGVRCGNHRWRSHSKKTLEGTAGCILAQLFVLILLAGCGLLHGEVLLVDQECSPTHKSGAESAFPNDLDGSNCSGGICADNSEADAQMKFKFNSLEASAEEVDNFRESKCGVYDEQSHLWWWLGVITTIVVCSIVEALITQVDNFVLPLLMFCGFSLSSFLL